MRLYYGMVVPDADAAVLDTYLRPVFQAFSEKGVMLSIQTERIDWPVDELLGKKPELKHKVASKGVEFDPTGTKVVIQLLQGVE